MTFVGVYLVDLLTFTHFMTSNRLHAYHRRTLRALPWQILGHAQLNVSKTVLMGAIQSLNRVLIHPIALWSCQRLE